MLGRLQSQLVSLWEASNQPLHPRPAQVLNCCCCCCRVTGGEVLNVLFAALIGGFALGQAAPNLQYFQQAKAAGGRVFHLMQRKPDIDPDAPGGL